MPEDSPYNAPPVIRALSAISHALDDRLAHPRRESPPNAGKPWSIDEDAMLDSVFASGGDLKPLSQALGRTLSALESRLVKLGKLPPRSGMRVSVPAAG